MSYDSLLQSFQKICVLVTFAYFLSRTELFARLFGERFKRRDRLRIFAFFSVLALVELGLTPELSPGSSRIVAVSAAGLLGGPRVGVGVGLLLGFVTTLILGPQYAYAASATIGGGLLGGWVAHYRPQLQLKTVAGFVVGALSHTLWLGMVFARDTLVGTWDANALLYGPPILLNGAAVALFLVMIGDMRAQQERIERESELAGRAELRALQAQVHPHFLFNALNTVAALCQTDSRKAAEIVIRLGEYFRSSLKADARTLIPVEQELANVRSYLEIELARFGDRISVLEDIGTGADGVLVPALSVQPLVENAIVHGLSRKPGRGRLKISVRRHSDRVTCCVVDDGAGMSEAQVRELFRNGDSHGLTILKGRLDRLYSGRARLKVRSREGVATAVFMSMPISGETE